MPFAWVVIAFLPGCSGVSYLLQAGKGQLELVNKAKPIEEVLKDERTPPRTRELLAQVSKVKAFGETKGLKPTTNYTEFVKLNRGAATYVVSACDPLKFKSKEWSFPIVGTFPYLGFFDLERAKEYAAEVRKEGLDVDVRGASAYSTLGWFRDAVLSTMIPDGEEALGDLINVVLHESVHATFYIKGQSAFDESLASFVADRLTYEYFDQILKANEPNSPHAKEKIAYREFDQSGEVRVKRFHEVYQELDKLYSSSKTNEEKLAEKKRVLDALKAELKSKRELNNASLVQFKTYNTDREIFEKLYLACGSDWTRFWKAILTLDEKSFGENQRQDLKPVLEALTEKCR